MEDNGGRSLLPLHLEEARETYKCLTQKRRGRKETSAGLAREKVSEREGEKVRERMRERVRERERDTFSMSESKVTNFYLRLESTFLLSRLPSIIFLL